MINFHPDETLLAAYAADTLPVGMAIAVAIHVEVCPHCAQLVAQYEQQLAVQWVQDDVASAGMMDADAMLAMILDQPVLSPFQTASHAITASITVQGQSFTLPRALRGMVNQHWQQFGQISRSRLALADQTTLHAALMFFAPGAAVPHHSHGGIELMLPLHGAFADELGDYQPGDFILHQAQVAHQPRSTEGCLCYSLLDAPAQFTDGAAVLMPGARELLY